ncbi:MAG: Antibiotic biosynthesis monooxygenase [Pelotomaculum sp. PtaB.Bin013]|uniref:Antibiotic biosynthesis monooxygenase n=1 Tax=Pelotomaculum isophthalicicum JI TaxID=947010 RepID=A0A9X4H5J3_9FIRM|nr:putative quinol monooxygenase [Pelotomaculum isophthalicicum]MDF9409708.1 antibiotic biosynthesis monooxygenase [Pelotomaculum isophthalicicum JI]OPX83219.1 MAG: Antibiotic biosynthesis monooxygenase [Pelotomaculum sp. PtaB.Bin013]
MITLVAKLKAKPGKEALLAEELIKQAKEVRDKEKECLMFIPHVSIDKPAEMVLFEKYADQEAFRIHFETPHFKAVAQKFDELLDGQIEVIKLNELV